ncbi:protein PTHB1 [Anoplophora glabripennis]|uniref:protein PTHB1 n=1 Tax=Anoplophora glabripennis TaxID=217634 RepID=UPI000874BCBE|nr:protein PTHB1 [Anoplophora glabripennis]
MSLFRVREFWTAQSEDGEYFDQNSLITTTLNSDSDFVITGSHSGVLRIFKPSTELEENNVGGFSATDLLLEKIFDDPILQVGCGRLVSGSQNLQLAVLHPRALCIYALKSKEGVTDHGTQNDLEHLYEHSLRRSAANFTIGPFGGTQNRDFICVQSLDGMLNFFEQENVASCCFIPDFLLPGPIAYVSKTDDFVTSSSNWCIVSYKYKSLSEAGEKFDPKVNSTRKINCDWSYNLGESVVDIVVIEDFMNKEAWIMVLGERNLFCLNSKGNAKFMKRLDYSPICFNVYVINDNIFSIVISETSTLLVYENTTLKWSAQLPFLPISIRRAFLKAIKGALVLLSEEGRLECCYLGTEPSLFVAPPIASKEIDFEKAEEELNNLNRIIKRSYVNDLKLSKTGADKELTMELKVNPDLVPCTFDSNIKDSENHQMCTVTVDIFPHTVYEEVQISVLVQNPLTAVPQVQLYTNLSEKTSFTYYVFLNEVCEVPSLNIEVVATAVSSLGVPRTLFKTSALPVNLVYQLCKPQKDNSHRITISINQSPVSLATLFPEYVDGETFSQSSSVIGFNNVTGAGSPVTILLAKSSGRYRLQADSFASLSLLTELMIIRLKTHYSDNGEFHVFYNSSLPANDVILYVNNHFKRRQRVNQLQDNLCQLSAQFRIVQKRLIAKFKVKNPTPLTNLEILLQDTYTEIMNATEQLEYACNELTKAQVELSCALNIVQNLLTIMDIDQELRELLVSTFCSSVHDMDSQGWEDAMDTSLCYLLRTVLAKSEKDKLRSASTAIEEVKDVTKLERHLVQVFERIPKKSKGQEQEFIADDEANATEKQSEVPLEESRPIGSQFGESSSRLLSARKSLLRRRHKQDS